MILKIIIIIFCFISTVTSFYGSPVLSFIKAKDYTHSDLVEIGILQAAAKFLEDVKVPWKTAKPGPGTLSGISDITARKLYDKYYGAEVSSHKFQLVMDQISQHNVMVDQDYGDQAHWHFNAEKIREANEKLISLRNFTFTLLAAAKPDYDAARVFIGQYLHVLHDFYSNTNWVDLPNGTAIYEDLGIGGKTLMSTAGPTVDTCNSCGPVSGLPCILVGALKKINLLTSGYRTGQGNASKPHKDPVSNSAGKCSHGGMFDSSGNTSAALGGINKETTTLEYSPLFANHDKAATLAIEHTRQFFINPGYGLKRYITQEKFMDLLELHAGDPVAFVIDTSSTDMLTGIKKFINDVISNTIGSVVTPSSYILVTVDTTANKTILQESKNATDISTWLNAITLPQAGSCAEFAIAGLQRAVVAAGQRSKIYVFSDSAPTNAGEIHFITALATEKEVSIHFLTDSSCKHRRKRGIYGILRSSRSGRWRRWSFTPPVNVEHRGFSVKFYVTSNNNGYLNFPTTTLTKGHVATLEVRILDHKLIEAITTLQLMNVKGRVIDTLPLVAKQTARGDNSYICLISIPREDFTVAVLSKPDSAGGAIYKSNKLFKPV